MSAESRELDHSMALFLSAMLGAVLTGVGFGVWFDAKMKRLAASIWFVGAMFLLPPLGRLLLEIWLS